MAEGQVAADGELHEERPGPEEQGEEASDADSEHLAEEEAAGAHDGPVERAGGHAGIRLGLGAQVWAHRLGARLGILLVSSYAFYAYADWRFCGLLALCSRPSAPDGAVVVRCVRVSSAMAAGVSKAPNSSRYIGFIIAMITRLVFKFTTVLPALAIKRRNVTRKENMNAFTHFDAAGQALDGLDERQVLGVAHEADDVAGLAAPEAHVVAERGVDVERRRLLVVERAQPLERPAAGVLERDVVGDHLVDPGALAHQRDVLVLDQPGHGRESTSRAGRARPRRTRQ